MVVSSVIDTVPFAVIFLDSGPSANIIQTDSGSKLSSKEIKKDLSQNMCALLPVSIRIKCDVDVLKAIETFNLVRIFIRAKGRPFDSSISLA